MQTRRFHLATEDVVQTVLTESGGEMAKQREEGEGIAQRKMQCAEMDVALGGMITNLPLVF